MSALRIALDVAFVVTALISASAVHLGREIVLLAGEYCGKRTDECIVTSPMSIAVCKLSREAKYELPLTT